MNVYQGKLVGVIGDQDTVCGFLLAGIGERNGKGDNFLVVDESTKTAEIEAKFTELTERRDIAVLLINQHIANDIRHLVKNYNALLPTILEIPSKEHPYDVKKDEVMKQVNLLLGYE